jgi:hypothetical protein
MQRCAVSTVAGLLPVPPMTSLNLSGLQNAYGTYGHHSQAAWANTYHPLQAAAQSSLQQYGNHGVSNSFLHMMGMR